MIVNFKDARAKALMDGDPVKGFPSDIIKRTRQMLVMLSAASVLKDMEVPPGNRLHALVGKRRGFHAVRINGKWRIVFRWTNSGPADVEIVDYHDEKK